MNPAQAFTQLYLCLELTLKMMQTDHLTGQVYCQNPGKAVGLNSGGEEGDD